MQVDELDSDNEALRDLLKDSAIERQMLIYRNDELRIRIDELVLESSTAKSSDGASNDSEHSCSLDTANVRGILIC